MSQTTQQTSLPTELPGSSQHTVPARAVVTSLLGLGPIPFTKVFTVLELVAEQNRRIAQRRDPRVLSHVEKSVRERPERRANRYIEKSVQKTLNPIVELVLSLTTKIAVLERQVQLVEGDPLVGPHGEQLSYTEAQAAHNRALAQVQQDSQNGETRHRRLPHHQRRWVKSLQVLDFPVLLLFFGYVLNVDINRPLATPVASATALVFSLFGTLAIAAVLHFLGDRHRAYKSARNQWKAPRGARVQPVIELAVVLLLIALIGTLMGLRILSEAEAAEAAPALGWVLAILFGLIIAAVNYVVYAVEYYNGSLTTEEIDRHAANLYRVKNTQQQLTARASLMREERQRQQKRGVKISDDIRESAYRIVAAGRVDQAIRYARSVHQGTGPAGDIPAPDIDLGPLEAADRLLQHPELVTPPTLDEELEEVIREGS